MKPTDKPIDFDGLRVFCQSGAEDNDDPEDELYDKETNDIFRDLFRCVTIAENAAKTLAARDLELKGLSDYIDYLVEADKMTAGYLHVHNWKYPPEFIERGNVLRAAIAIRSKEGKEG